jgi:hypothetical protein
MLPPNTAGKRPEELSDWADQILLMAQHVRRHLRRRRLKKSRRERLARTRARRKMRGGLGHLIGERIEIEHLRIGVNRRNAVLIRLGLHVGENVVALLHLHERIADTRPILAIAGQGVQHAPVIVHRFAARFAIRIAGKRDVAPVRKQRQQFGADFFIFDGVKRPRPQPRAVKRDQVHQRVAGMNRRQALLDAQPRNARIHIFGALRWRRLDLVRRVRIRRFQFRAMHFRLPLQVRIFVHLVGPHRRVQLEPTCDGDDFLTVRQAASSRDTRNGDALGLSQVGVRQFRAALQTRHRAE